MAGQTPARSQLLNYGVRAPRPIRPLGIIHPLHSRQARKAVADQTQSASGSKVTFVITGCSIGLLSGNQAFNELETISGQLAIRLRQDNPDVPYANWNFINRAIGGTTWNHLATFPPAGTTFPAWYTSTTQPWIDTYISPAGGGSGGTPNAPDVVVIVCPSVNDLDAIAFANIRSVINKFANTTLFPVTPDIWICTCTGRTIDPAASSPGQIYGQWVGGAAERFLSLAGPAALNSTYPKPIGLLDFHRQDAITRLGSDPARQVIEQVVTGSNNNPIGAALAVTLPQCEGDLDVQFTLAGQAATLFANAGQLRAVIGAPTNSGTSESYVALSKNSTLLAAQYISGGALTSTLTNTTLDNGTTHDVVCRVVAQQQNLMVYCQGTKVFDDRVFRGHGPFQPRLYFSVEPPGGTNVNIDFYRAGRRQRYAPTILDTDVWDRTGNGTGKYGGGSANHPGSAALAENIRAMLEAQSLCVTA
jgi:hypothetical protein